MQISHLPTWLLIIGYPIFWIMLHFRLASDGVTGPLSWILLLIVCVVLLCLTFNAIEFKQNAQHLWVEFKSLTLVDKILMWFIFGLSLFIIAISFLAASKPIHLTQEFDCLNYHYTLPRQHLILGSFNMIPWAADDLFLLPIDIALAPFWFSSFFPNKWPQLIGIFGLLFILCNFIIERKQLINRVQALVFLMGLFWCMHGFGIQFGTGMLDLFIVYLGVACWDSYRKGQLMMAAIEGAFLFWSKPIMPIACCVIIFLTFVVMRLIVWQGFKVDLKLSVKEMLSFLGYFLVFSFIIASPFWLKSLQMAGTPLYPLWPGYFSEGLLAGDARIWQSVVNASQMWLHDIKASYGEGYGIIAWLKHWWQIAIPDSGVNNKYDYPLGLGYLVALGLFMTNVINDIKKQQVSSIVIMIAVMWLCWWFGSQQSRFLFMPLMLMIFYCAIINVAITRITWMAIIIALCFNALSLYRSHHHEFNQLAHQTVRSQDIELMRLCQQYQGKAIDWPSHDVAYATCPVNVTQEKLPHTLFSKL